MMVLISGKSETERTSVHTNDDTGEKRGSGSAPKCSYMQTSSTTCAWTDTQNQDNSIYENNVRLIMLLI